MKSSEMSGIRMKIRNDILLYKEREKHLASLAFSARNRSLNPHSVEEKAEIKEAEIASVAVLVEARVALKHMISSYLKICEEVFKVDEEVLKEISDSLA